MHREETLLRKSQSQKHNKRKCDFDLKTKGAENITNWINLFLHLSTLILSSKHLDFKEKKAGARGR